MSASAMLRMGVLAGMLAILASCATVPDRVAATARLERTNARAQAAVAMLLPWLDADRADRVRRAAGLVDAAIAKVTAAAPAERVAAIEAAERAIADYRWQAAR